MTATRNHTAVATCLFIVLFWSMPAPGETILPDHFVAHYSFEKDGISVGVVKRTLGKLDNGSYEFKSLSEATGLLSLFISDKLIEHTTISIQGKQIRPLAYTYLRSGGRKKREVKLVFDWKRNLVINTINGDPWQMEIPDDVQDKLSYQLLMMLDLQNGHQAVDYQIADGGKVKNYHFDIIGRETISTPLGKLETVKLLRSDDKRDTTIWCAAQLDYLPVRIEQQEDDGDHLKMVIQKVEGLPAARLPASTGD